MTLRSGDERSQAEEKEVCAMTLPVHRPVSAPLSPQARRSLRLAWIWVAGIPVAFVGAMILGDWLLSMQGYSSSDERIPLAVLMRAGLPALALLVLPCVSAAWFGLRARGRGAVNGLAPVVIGATVGIASIAMNTLQLIASFFDLG
jgi:hypothetical protein